MNNYWQPCQNFITKDTAESDYLKLQADINQKKLECRFKDQETIIMGEEGSQVQGKLPSSYYSSI